jgi:hypothetical protein
MRYSEARDVKRALGALTSYRGQSFAGFTGTMAAALAAGSTVFAARYPAAAPAAGMFLVQWMHLHFTCIGSFATPVTAGRRLSLKRGSGGDPTTGTAIDVVRNVSSEATETLLTGQVATTAALTMTGVTYETPTRSRLMLSEAGSSGFGIDEIWQFDDPFFLLPGELFGIVAPALFDASGTWQLSVKGGGVEVL